MSESTLRSQVIAALPSTRKPTIDPPKDPLRDFRAPVTTSTETSVLPRHGGAAHPAGTRPPTHQISLVAGRHSATLPSNATSCRVCGSPVGHHDRWFELAPFSKSNT